MGVALKTGRLRKIVSGGQTGADRAALDWAISRGVPHGGWCAKGRKAEDGPIPARYDFLLNTTIPPESIKFCFVRTR
jgi:hypothetical protein